MQTKKQNNKNVPNLRFPGFEGEWERKMLGDLGKINPPTKKLPDKFIYVDLESVVNGELTEKQEINLNEAPTRAQRLLEINDILFQMIRPYQKNNFFFNKVGNYVASTGYTQLRTRENPKFIYCYLHFQKFVDKVIEKCTGTSYPAISSTALANIIIAVPSLLEQQIIASFLTTIDERISTQNKIIKGLTVLKALLSKKIFNRNLHFPKFTNEWIETTLGEVCEKKASNISANKIENNFGDYVIYGASGKLRKVDFYEVENDYIGVVKDGAGVGRLFYCKGKSSVLSTLDVIKPKKNINPYFLYCLLSNIDFNKYTTGSTIPHIYFKDYASERIMLPTWKEQQKVANFLFAVDQKIETEVAILNLLNKQKKYLLQQMFI